MRLPLAVGLESRAGAVTKDAKVLNGLIEKVSDEIWRMRKRPGVQDYATVRVGTAQLLTYWNSQIVTAIADYLNVNTSALVVYITTWNQSDKGANVTLTNGNLTVAVSASSYHAVRSTATKPAGIWHWEVTIGANNPGAIGVANLSANMSGAGTGLSLDANSMCYMPAGGVIQFNAFTVASVATATTGDVISIDYDIDNRTVQFKKNGTALGSAVTTGNLPAGTLYAAVGGNGIAAGFNCTANFGPTFLYAPSTSSWPLSPTTSNLPMYAQDNGSNAPTPYLMVKSREHAWTVNPQSGVARVTDLDYPASYAVTLTSLTRSGSIATATTAAEGNFRAGDTVTIAGATQTEYNGAKVVTSVTPASSISYPAIDITITRSGTTATATTVSEPHGFTNGQSVTIAGAFQTQYNGTKTITWISATSFSFTVSFTAGNTPTSPATGSPALGSRVRLGLNNTMSITNAPAGTTTFTLSGIALTGLLSNGDTVYLPAGMMGNTNGPFLSFGGSYVVANVTAYTFDITVPGGGGGGIQTGTVAYVEKVITPATITGITFGAASEVEGYGYGLATATTSAAHGLSAAGMYITISGATPDAYNGLRQVTSVPSTTTFIYAINYTPDVPTTPATGTITAQQAAAATGFQFTYVVSGSPATPATTASSITATLGKNTVPGIVYFDGFFLVMDDNGVVYNSDEDDPRNWTALEYLIAQAETGAGKAIARTINYVVCFKEWSTEFLYNAANEPPGSPFSPVPNLFTLVGCATGYSVAEVGGNLLWIAQEKKQRGRSVYIMSGSAQQKISTPDIDRILDADSLATVNAYGAKFGGHPCYVLTLVTTGITLVYDLGSGMWSQWSSNTLGSNQSISSITRSGSTATVTFGSAHGLSDGDPLKVSGANQSEYNGIFQVSYVSATVVTVEVTGAPATPATGTLVGNAYTESYLKFTKYADCGGLDMVLHESDGHLYQVLSTLYQDAGIPINWFARTRRQDGGAMNLKKCSRATIVADSVSDTAMLRWSDDDSSTFESYRRVTLSDVEPNIRRLGSFKRRSFEFRHVGNTAPVVEALELEVSQ